MINPFIRRILKKPGRYVITSFPAMAHGGYYVIDVDEEGKAWQLTPSLERDGELRPDGWKGNEFALDARCLEEPL